MASENPGCRCGHRRSQHYNGEICIVIIRGAYIQPRTVCSCSYFWPKGKKHVHGYGYALTDRYEPESLDTPIRFGESEKTLADTLIATYGDPTEFIQESDEALNVSIRKQGFIELSQRYLTHCTNCYQKICRSRTTSTNSYQRTVELAMAKREESRAYTDFMIFDLWMYGHKTKKIVDIMNSLRPDGKFHVTGVTKSIKKLREWAQKEYDLHLPRLSNEHGSSAPTIQERNAKIIEIVLQSGLSCAAVAKQFGISSASASNIVNDYKWAQKRKELEKEFFKKMHEAKKAERAGVV